MLCVKISNVRLARGFTLIELAISLTIIGLLMALVMRSSGVLDSSKINDVIATANDISSASHEFKDSYKFLPGDFAATTSVFTEVGAAPFKVCISGNSNGIIEKAKSNESACVPSHLFFAGFTKAYGTDPISKLYVFQSTYGKVEVLSISDSATYNARNDKKPVGVSNVIEFSNIPCKIAEAVDLKIDNGDISTGKGQASVATCDTKLGGSGPDALVSYAVAL